MSTLPPSLMPELRAKWIKLAGAREVVQHAAAHVQALEADYQQTLNVCLRFLDIDPGKDWRVDLETGEITPAPPQDQNGAGADALAGAVPGQ